METSIINKIHIVFKMKIKQLLRRNMDFLGTNTKRFLLRVFIINTTTM